MNMKEIIDYCISMAIKIGQDDYSKSLDFSDKSILFEGGHTMKRLLFFFTLLLSCFQLQSVYASDQLEKVQMETLASFNDSFWAYRWEGNNLYVEAKNQKYFQILNAIVKTKEKEFGGIDSKIIIEKPKIYSLQELTQAKERLLVSANSLGIWDVEIDEDLNAVVFSGGLSSNYAMAYKEGSGEEIHSIEYITEISHVAYISKKIPKQTSLKKYPYDYDNPFESKNTSIYQMRIDAGKILMNREQLSVDGVLVEDSSILVSVIDMTEQKQNAIKNVAGESANRIRFVSRKQPAYHSATVSQKYIIEADKGYVGFQGMLIEIKNAPHWENDNLMVPFLEIADIVKNTHGAPPNELTWYPKTTFSPCSPENLDGILYPGYLIFNKNQLEIVI